MRMTTKTKAAGTLNYSDLIKIGSVLFGLLMPLYWGLYDLKSEVSSVATSSAESKEDVRKHLEEFSLFKRCVENYVSVTSGKSIWFFESQFTYRNANKNFSPVNLQK